MAVRPASIGTNGHWIFTESNPIVQATCTRYTDTANNSDKYRWFFTITSGTNPAAQPVWFTQTGRWTAAHSESAYFHTLNNSGVVKFGGVVSANSWRRNGQNPGQIHDALVTQKLNGYTKMPKTTPVRETQTVSALLTRVGQVYTPGASTPAPVPTPPAPAPRPGTPSPISNPAGAARDAIAQLNTITTISTAQARVQLCEQALIEKKIDHFDGLSIAADSRKTIEQLRIMLAALEVSTNKLYATALEQGF